MSKSRKSARDPKITAGSLLVMTLPDGKTWIGTQEEYDQLLEKQSRRTSQDE